MLGKTTALDRWTELEHPDDRTWRRVAEVVLKLGEHPWVAPSHPVPAFLTGQPTEIREIEVEGTQTVITYEHEHTTGKVDLLLVKGR